MMSVADTARGRGNAAPSKKQRASVTFPAFHPVRVPYSQSFLVVQSPNHVGLMTRQGSRINKFLFEELHAFSTTVRAKIPRDVTSHSQCCHDPSVHLNTSVVIRCHFLRRQLTRHHATLGPTA